MTQRSQSKTAKSPPTAPTPDRFMQTLRQSLEHIDDDDWLSKNSPLASVFFAGASVTDTRRRQVILTGLQEVDTRLRTIWHAWEERRKSPLQSVLWEAVCHLPVDLDSHTQAILLLTYFDNPRPKQSRVIKMLALGRSTYYRYLERAVETLSTSLVQTLRPALRLEQPQARPLIGRSSELAQAEAALAAGRVVHLVGGAGLGKTSLGAELATRWQQGGVFWYTFRTGLTDHLEQFLFALAYFLHEQGASGLWLYLNTNAEALSRAKALMAIRQHLQELRNTPPLLCLDEVDLLLASDLSDSPDHAELRTLLHELVTGTRSHVPLLFMGQKLLIEPDEDCLILLAPFQAKEIATLLRNAKIALSADEETHLLAVTRGNPLLLRLFLVLHERGTPLSVSLERFTTPVTLDWFLMRLREHLTPAELTLLHELSIFASNAPQDVWRSSRKHLLSLVQLGLVYETGNASVALHPALRERIYASLPVAQRGELHLAAAQLMEERARFTDAAWHYVHGGRPEAAIWTWYTHRQHEINQGQSSAALNLFAPLADTPLPHAEDERARALLLAPLFTRAGRSQEGLLLLDRASWPAAATATALAHEARGELLAEMGAIDGALAEYRRSLEDVAQLRATQEAELHINIGRRAFAYLGDNALAQREVMAARLNLEILQGELASAEGNAEAARTHYTKALALVNDVGNAHQRAKVHEALGILEARYTNPDAAIAHLTEAGRHYQAAGNEVCAVGMTNANVAMTYLIMRRYAEAIPPAQRALAYFRQLNHAYWIALNETYLAEAWLYLDELDKAEDYAQAALRCEEVIVRPYCLFLLGHVRRRQKHYDAAQELCHEAIAAGEAIPDPWALGPAWSALGETLRDMGRPHDAYEAITRAIAIFTQLNAEQEVAIAQSILTSIEQSDTEVAAEAEAVP